MRHIPNIITSLNLASGFLSIILIIKGNTAAACWLVLAAMVFDFLDGLASRILNAYSDLGKELDSLADVVSFGVAPGIIIYSTGIFFSDNNVCRIIYAVISAFYAVCAGLRLAKFNIDTSQSVVFRGLPTPAAALSVISLCLAAAYSDNFFMTLFTKYQFLTIFFVIIVSLLMVSNLPMISLKIKNLKIKGNEARYILAALSIIFVAVFGAGGFALIIPAYIILSLAWAPFLKNEISRHP